MHKVNPKEHPYGIEPDAERVYFEVNAACSQCEEAGAIQEGHFMCHLSELPEGFRDETAPILTDSGWKILISCTSEKMALEILKKCVEQIQEYSYTPGPGDTFTNGHVAIRKDGDIFILVAGDDWKSGYLNPVFNERNLEVIFRCYLGEKPRWVTGDAFKIMEKAEFIPLTGEILSLFEKRLPLHVGKRIVKRVRALQKGDVIPEAEYARDES